MAVAWAFHTIKSEFDSWPINPREYREMLDDNLDYTKIVGNIFEGTPGITFS
jgi:hypothetical protein